MERVSEQLWKDLEDADRLGEVELAKKIAARIKEIQNRGAGFYALDALERVGDVAAGAVDVGLQIPTGIANRIAPESGIAKGLTDAADYVTGAREQLSEERDARMAGDRIGQITGTGTDIGTYFLPTGVVRGAAAAPGVASRIAQSTARDVADVTAQGLLRGGRDPESLEENLAMDAGMAGGFGAGLGTVGAGLRAARQGASKAGGLLGGQSAAGRAAEEAAARRGVTDLLRGEDLVNNPAVRNLSRAGGDAIDSFTGRNQRLLQGQKDAFLDQVGAGIDDALDLDFMGRVGKSFERKYREIQQVKNRLYNNATRQLDPLLGKLDANTPAKGSGQSLNRRLQRTIQELVDEYGINSPVVKEIREWGQFEPGKFSTWTKRRRGLGRKVRSMAKAPNRDDNLVDAYSRVLKEVDAQLDDWAGTNNEWRKANKYYRENVVPYKENVILKKIAPDGSRGKLRGDLVAEKIFTPNDPRVADVEMLFGKMDEGGLQDAYRAFIQRVKNKATRNDEGVEIPWSSARAATELEKMATRLERSAPSKEIKQAIDDWRKIFRATEQASMDAARSPTGRSLAQMGAPIGASAAVGAMVGGDPITGATIGAVAPVLLAMSVRSPKVRAMMRKLAEMPEKHPDRKGLEQQLATLASRVAAGANGE